MGGDQYKTVAFVAGRVVRISQAVEHDIISNIPGGGKHLGAVDHPHVPVKLCRGGGNGHITPGIRFRDGRSDDGISGHQPGQDFGFLRLCTEKTDNLRSECTAENGHADSRVHCPEFLGNEAVFQKTISCPPVFLINEDPHKSKITCLFPEFQVKGLSPVKFKGPVRELAPGKFAGCLNNILLFLVETEIHWFIPFLMFIAGCF